MTKIRIAYGILVLGLVLTTQMGCSAKVETATGEQQDKPADKGQQAQNPGTQPVQPATPAAPSAEELKAAQDSLQGTWTINCHERYSATVTYTGSEFAVDATIFADEGCGIIMAKDSHKGTFKLGAKLDNGAREIDFIWSADGSDEHTYDIFKVDGSQLYLGELSGDTASLRPKKLGAAPYLRP